MTRNGELVQRQRSMVWEFTRDDGSVISFEVRMFPSDDVWMRGTRKK